MIPYSMFASYIANLPAERWVRGIHFQHILPAGAHDKLGAESSACKRWWEYVTQNMDRTLRF